MAAAKIDIDRLAREAQAETEQDSVDLLTVKLPITPWGWQILVEPLEPKTRSDGGLYLPKEALQAQQVQTTVGRVLALGPSALQGKTNSGIVLADLAPKRDGTLTRAQDLIGKYVIHQRYVGHPITLREYNKTLLLLSVTEILGGCDDPTALVYYV